MYSEALGRVNNVHYPADDVYIALRDAAGITFYVHEVDGATQAVITFASDAAGTGAETPSVIDHYYGKSADVSNGVWHKTTMTAGDTVTKADGTEDLIAIEILANMAPSGKSWVKCTADGSGIVFAVLHDLSYPRTPANLRSVIA